MIMASSNGNSSRELQKSGVTEVDRRKRKRMESNRESARRSREKKRKHLGDLTAHLADLKKDNALIFSSISLDTRNWAAVAAENSALRTQMAELTQTLRYLTALMNLNSIDFLLLGGGACTLEPEFQFHHMDRSEESLFPTPRSSVENSQQLPIMAAAEIMSEY